MKVSISFVVYFFQQAMCIAIHTMVTFPQCSDSVCANQFFFLILSLFSFCYLHKFYATMNCFAYIRDYTQQLRFILCLSPKLCMSWQAHLSFFFFPIRNGVYLWCMLIALFWILFWNGLPLDCLYEGQGMVDIIIGDAAK